MAAEEKNYLPRETCKSCGRENPIGFRVSDAIWETVIGLKHRDHVICITCFTEWADQKRVAWDVGIELYSVSRRTNETSQGFGYE